MLANLVKSIFPGNTSQTFEKARIQATYEGDTNPPLEKDLINILSTFKDKNPEMRGTSAFYLTLANIQANRATKPWNYILKNFVLFDKAIDEKCFAKEISELELNQIGNYKSTPGKHGEKLDLLLKRYFRYLKAKGRIYNTKHFQFDLPCEQQKHYLGLLSPDKLFLESKRLRSLIILAFDLFEIGVQEIIKYQLNQYVFLLVFNTLTKIFSLQYLTFVLIAESRSFLRTNEIVELHENFKQFFHDIESFLTYYNKLKAIVPGLQISREQIYDLQAASAIFKSLENYITALQANKSAQNLKMNSKTAAPITDDFSPKAPEIIFTSFVEIGIPRHQGDDHVTEANEDLKSWDDVQKLGTRNLHTEKSCSPIRERLRTPECVPKIFKDSFHIGFKLLINDAQRDMNGPGGIVKSLRGKKSLDEINDGKTTCLFRELLCLEEHDDLFESYSNLYSSDFSDVPQTEAAQRIINDYDQEQKLTSKAQAYDYGNVLKRLSLEMNKIEDFDQDLFDNFKNTYSDS